VLPAVLAGVLLTALLAAGVLIGVAPAVTSPSDPMLTGGSPTVLIAAAAFLLFVPRSLRVALRFAAATSFVFVLLETGLSAVMPNVAKTELWVPKYVLSAALSCL
jgi:hypothetical protein